MIFTEKLKSKMQILRVSLFIAIILFIYQSSIAQDKIYQKNDSNFIEAKVREINDIDVKYVKFSNQNGPVYLIKKSSVSMIVYENGEKDIFKSEEKIIEQSSVIVTSDSVLFIEELWGIKLENTPEKGGGVHIVKIEPNSIFKPRSPLNRLYIFNVNNGGVTVRVRNTSELARVLFLSYNQGISKINLLTGTSRFSDLASYTNDIKGFDLCGLAKFQEGKVPMNKNDLAQSKKAGLAVSKIYHPSQMWVMQGFCSGMLFGLPGVGLVGIASIFPPIPPTVPPNVDGKVWVKAYSSRIKKKRLVSGLIGGALGAFLVIGAFSSVN